VGKQVTRRIPYTKTVTFTEGSPVAFKGIFESRSYDIYAKTTQSTYYAKKRDSKICLVSIKDLNAEVESM